MIEREIMNAPRMVTSSHCATMRASTGRRAPNLSNERAEVMLKSMVTMERLPVATLSLFRQRRIAQSALARASSARHETTHQRSCA